MAVYAPEIEQADIHSVLSNERRRLAIECLRRNGGSMRVRELSEHIGAVESGEDPPPRNVRHSVYVSLLQTHLPKLDTLGIVDYDADGKLVNVKSGIDQVAVYLETVPKYGISWSEYYLLIASLGFLTVFAAEYGVPVIGELSGIGWAYVFLVVIGLSGLYQTVGRESSIIHRVRTGKDESGR